MFIRKHVKIIISVIVVTCMSALFAFIMSDIPNMWYGIMIPDAIRDGLFYIFYPGIFISISLSGDNSNEIDLFYGVLFQVIFVYFFSVFIFKIARVLFIRYR